jgi:hypothetical protein
MSTDTTTTTWIQRPPSFFYLGRPASLYKKAIAMRPRTRSEVARRSGGAEK